MQEKEDDLLRIDDIVEIDAAASSEINSKFTMYLREGDSEQRREQFYCKELGMWTRFIFQKLSLHACQWI